MNMAKKSAFSNAQAAVMKAFHDLERAVRITSAPAKPKVKKVKTAKKTVKKTKTKKAKKSRS